VLKLDKSFVDGVVAAPEDAALCHAVIRLGAALKLTVVAEGIEAYEQAVELHRLGCDLGQAYYFARPVTAEDATELLRLPWIADQRPTAATAVTGQPAPSGPARVESGRPAPAER
jgi:EAL domain-containing protein (putative c-di-GMP-specific phosphodiesterase class I)